METKRIFIVDDNEELARVIQHMLEDEGFEVKLAKDVQDGYWAFLEFKPDLVITDIQMPGGNGLELMEHIRMVDPTVRTIYMSGDFSSFWWPLEEERERYPVSLLEKPFCKDELMKLVSAWQPNSNKCNGRSR